ncbi:Nn.00g086900.m01.CDS01 [Neocucurbitaria sp. VM-36]
MPRQGDGSSDNGPIEGHDIVHGASGDTTLQHAKNNVAPMPEIEKGEAIEGLNASGGGDAPKAGHTGQGKAASDSNKPAPVDQATK